MKPQSFLKLNLATATVMIALVAGWWTLGVGPIRSSLAKAEDLAQAIDTAKTERAAADRRLKELAVRIDDAEAALANQPFTLRPPHALNTLLAELADASRTLNVRLDVVSPRPPTTKDRYRVTPIDVRAEAGYIETGRWLTALRNRFPDVSLTSLSIERSPAGLATTRARLVWFSARTTSN
ncbi:MAG: type 4a pilus biogenesis protein PilO [Planctomycetota bacterium]